MAMTGTQNELVTSEPQCWHALYVRHQHEKAIAEILTGRGFEAFAPVYGEVRRWKDRAKHLVLPLFPCYLFLHGGLRWKALILGIPGVYRFVSIGGKAAEIPAAEVDAVRRAANGARAVEPHPFLRCGDRVRLRSGSLAGVEGILVRKKGSLRLVLSAEMLERSISVEVDVCEVENLAPQTMAAGEGLSW